MFKLVEITESRFNSASWEIVFNVHGNNSIKNYKISFHPDSGINIFESINGRDFTLLQQGASENDIVNLLPRK